MTAEISNPGVLSTGDAVSILAWYGVAVTGAVVALVLIVLLVLRLTVFSRPEASHTAPR
ncbi:MAG TPA: hypothetical protein VEY14_08820 [Nocardioidaceae bacterium]|jgi:hypothetical protein|nr:hypothetical protein [Nocardioidaceae bacterium]